MSALAVVRDWDLERISAPPVRPGRHLVIRACEGGAKVQQCRIMHECEGAILLDVNGALVPFSKIGERHLESERGRLFEVLMSVLDGAL